MKSKLLLPTLAASLCFSSMAAANIFEKLGIISFQSNHKKQEIPVVGSITSAEGAPLGHGTVAMIQGRLAIIWAPDSGNRGGGFSFLDFDTSNPNKPQAKLIHQEKNEAIREGHGFGFHVVGKSIYTALQTIRGLQIWDWSDLNNPKLITDMTLPGIEESDYNRGAWWVFWQAPYIYVGGSGNGLYVIDAHDMKNPQLAARINPENFKLERMGPTFAVGNMLVSSMNNGYGVATIDISNPLRPRLLDSSNSHRIYSMLFNGSKVLIAGADKDFYSLNVSEQGKISFDSSIGIGDKGGYVTYQDGFAFVGASKQAIKIDIRQPRKAKIVSWASSKLEHRDEDFANVIGPYIFISDDHGNGSYIAKHTDADKTGPSVNMVSPAASAKDQALTSRIGLTFTDQIDISSINEKTFIVRPKGGSQLKGYYSTQTNIVNFTPERPLSANQEYEVEIVAGGIKDYFSNPTPGFKSSFKTGNGQSSPDLKVISAVSGRAGETMTFQVGGGTANTLYSWDFGDGGGYRAASASTQVQYKFNKPGHYSVSVRAEGKNIYSSDAFKVTVHAPLTAQRPSNSSSIVADHTRRVLYNVNPDQGTVTAVSMDSLNVLWEVPTGKDPKSLALDKQSRLWVANSRDESVSVLEASSGNLLKKISLPYGSMPFGVAASPAGDKVLVSLAARGELAVMSTSELRVMKYVRLGTQPRAIAISGDGTYALISRFISPETRGEIYRVDLQTDLVSVIGLAIEKTPDTEASGRGLPNYLGFLSISPDGLSAWVPSKKDNIQRGLTRDGLVPTFESSVRAIVSQIDLTKNAETLALRNDFNDRDMPVAVEYSPLGDYIFVAVQGSNTVEVVDAYSGELITGLEKVGLAPQGLVLSADGKKLFVHSFLSRQVIAYDIARLDRVLKLKEISVVSHETLSEEELLGKQIFYNSKDRRMSRDGYISCASCHQDGGEDGRVWDFTDRGEGLRNSITLRGRSGMGQGRVHWTGNFDEIQDFENDIRNNFGGLGFLTDAQFQATQDTLGAKKAGLSKELDAMAAYVHSLSESEKSPYRQADGSFTEDAVKGQKIFDRLQCAQCHSGPDFTDSATGVLHNVGTATHLSGKRRNGTLTGFDTPTLKGIWATPPYLHDGSAGSLRDVFTKRNSSGAHGKTQSLTQEELNQLVQYLLSL